MLGAVHAAPGFDLHSETETENLPPRLEKNSVVQINFYYVKELNTPYELDHIK